MTTENTAGAETTGSAATGETEATLEQMRANEGGESGAEGAKEPVEPSEKAKEEKVVPLAALHEERNARKELQRQMAEDRRKQAERDAIIERRLAALANPQPQAPTRPDPVEQPVAYIDHRLEGIERQNQAILERDQQREQQNQQQAAYQRVASAVVQQAVAFAKEVPDLPDAVAHLNAVRVRQLAALGVPEHEAVARATQELDNAALQWTAEGRNAAQIAYEFAKTSGYAPKASQQQQQQSPAEKIEAQRKGTAAARSLGGGGNPNAGKLTAEALANMSDEDFAQLSEAQFRQAMGG
jgi:hypothetical protein